jgi:ATP-dependent RNA helicase DeaD
VPPIKKRDITLQNFDQLGLSPQLLKAISGLGYEKPSPIQAATLPILLGAPTDFLGLAATGTGKTAAFAIPLLEKINPTRRVVQALILCPTRELAIQVAGQIDLLGKQKGIRALPIYGGSNYETQLRGLREGVSIVVGTPGRVVDHMERGTLRLSGLETIILDEADEMISMGFKEELEFILEKTPRDNSNIWLFSATMSREVRKVADEYLRSPQQVEINRTEMVPELIEQLYYITKESNKPDVLCKLMDAAEDFYGIIFCQTKSMVTDLTQFLVDRGYKVDCLHGDKDQKARERTMQSFREKKVNLLVCTDVASRGLDVKDITHVINFSLPRELDSYVHRIGRTARSGKTGFAMSLVSPSQRGLIGRIEKTTKSRMKEGKIPTRREIGSKKLSKILPQFEAQQNFARAIELMDPSWKTAIAEMSPQELAARFLSMMYPEVFATEKETEQKSQSSDRAYGSIFQADSRDDSRGQRSFRRDRDGGGRQNHSFHNRNERPRSPRSGRRDQNRHNRVDSAANY